MALTPSLRERQTNVAGSAIITDRSPPLTSSGASLVAAASVMVVLTTCWTAFRIWARRITKISYLAEDYLYFAAQLLYYGAATGFILAVTVGGAGHDIWSLSDEHKHHYFRISLATQVLYASALGFVKLSITWMLQRVFFGHSTTFRLLAWVAMGLSVCWAVYTALIGFVICQPVQMAWDPSVQGTCGNHTMAYSAVAIFDIITDVFIVALPVKFVAQLQVRRAHKIALYGVFCAGIITIVFSCVRLYYAYNIDFINVTKGFAVASVSGVIQAGIGVMVASSPMLRPVFDRTVGRVLGLSLQSKQRDGTGPTSNDTGATDGSNVGLHSKRHMRSDRFKQMSESEEHLAWELRNMKRGVDRISHNIGTTTTHVKARNSGDTMTEDESASSVGAPPRTGEILVTTTTEVRR
ncbi:Satratoxin biosynthesis SC1 cluster protein 4 [Colletotrichum orbiculare MAFF 240422]|uniref:Satratoxin biosynthesis SC1 cluster protein 4 n=1 Tax=Colletotrichum orbiculare (strain 104-T / ATCC 96160 / CBS 514.97 / LARS 414 / MAFF 240422) TaxID=1213857 RepID=N4V2K8_COLOR|nr:Satratoxin biosynthesis SC1 cluster protein 4 [Colletotrichum orbiculare MAFF 240422]